MTALPPVAAGLLAATLLAAAALCGLSLLQRRAAGPRVVTAEANHVVMGLAMAAMVLPATAGVIGAPVGVALFGALAVGWAVVTLTRRGRGGDTACTARPGGLVLGNAAMVVMYVAMLPVTAPATTAGAATAATAMTAMPGMPGMAHGGTPSVVAASGSPVTILGAAFAVALLVHAATTVGSVVQLRRTAVGAVGPGGAVGGAWSRGVAVLGSPPVQLACQAVTGVAMALMLLML